MHVVRRVVTVFLLFGLVSCSSGLGKGNSNPQATGNTTPSGNILQAFDLGMAPTGGVSDSAAVAAVLPGESGDLRVVFVAYSSPAPASELIDPPPTDTNASSDVFVAAVVNIASADGTPTAFNQALLEVFEHPRCVTCHGFPATAPVGHPGGFDPAVDCSGCHNAGTIGVAGLEWFSPATVGQDLDFRDKDAAELVAQIAAWEVPHLAADPTFRIIDHVGNDSRVFWAFESGVVPQDRPRRTTVPVDFMEFLSLVEAWDAAGRPVTTASAIRDTALVSSVAGGAAANGASHSPAIAFVPAVAPGPGDPLGALFIAYISSGSDLPGTGAAGVDQLFWTRVDVFLDAGDVVRLVSQPTVTRLASHTFASSSARSNAASARPAISSDGTRVVFESLATDVGVIFTDNNGAAEPDVFEYQRTGDAVQLLSATAPGSGLTGNAGSRHGTIDPTGQWTAFASDATDLVSGDSNNVRDVFYRPLTGADLTIRRASVRSDGSQGSGGDSDHPTASVSSGTLLVAFESQKRNLTDDSVTAEKNVYLFDDAGPATTLISRNLSGVAGNGDSGSPRLTADGTSLAFESRASNLDDIRTTDGNSLADVVVTDLATFLTARTFSSQRLTVTSAGADSDGDSTLWAVASFERSEGSYEETSALFSTAATNLSASTSTDRVLAFVKPNFNPLCTLQATPSSLLALTGDVVTFDGSGSSDPDGDTIVQHSWDFGDGGSALGATVSYSYAVAGVYTVVQTVEDSRGARSTCSVTMTINFNNTLPTAVPGTYPTTAEDIAITFDGSGSSDVDPGDSIVQYSWDFGDATPVVTSATATAVHTFADPGVYTVALTVTDMFGGTGTASTAVTIVANTPPTCNITGLASADAGDTVTFSSTIGDETPGTVTRQWTTNGGTITSATSTAASVNIQFPVSGTFTVTLTVTDAFTATGTCTHMIVVDPVVPTSFADVYTQIIDVMPFDCNRSGCHDGVNQDPALNGQATAFGNLVGQPADTPCDPGPAQIYVVGGDLPNSYLIEKLTDATPTCGGQMPDGGPFLTDAPHASLLNLIQSWVSDGANP